MLLLQFRTTIFHQLTFSFYQGRKEKQENVNLPNEAPEQTWKTNKKQATACL